jgi:hypothetical protein
MSRSPELKKLGDFTTTLRVLGISMMAIVIGFSTNLLITRDLAVRWKRRIGTAFPTQARWIATGESS